MKFSFKRICLTTMFAAFLAAGFFLTGEYLKNEAEHRKREALHEQKASEWESLSLRLVSEINGFSGISGVFIKDLKHGFEFRHNEYDLFPSASLAKIPIMAAAYKAEYEGILDLGKEVRLTEMEKLSGSGKLKSLPAGTVFTVEDLIGLMISISDNTATNMLTSVLGLDYINDAIADFGLRDSRLYRRVADYAARARGLENYTTAADMGLILEKIYRGDMMSKKISERCLELLSDQQHRDRIPKHLPRDAVVAHKTGLERGVCHDAGIVFDDRGDLLICVLTKHSNPNSRPSKNFIAKLAFLVYARHDIPSPDIGDKAAVKGRIETGRPVKLTIRDMQTLLREHGFYRGPIDGIAGPATRRSIKDFQRRYGLIPDGIAGVKTRAVMLDLIRGEDPGTYSSK